MSLSLPPDYDYIQFKKAKMIISFHFQFMKEGAINLSCNLGRLANFQFGSNTNARACKYRRLLSNGDKKSPLRKFMDHNTYI